MDSQLPELDDQGYPIKKPVSTADMIRAGLANFLPSLVTAARMGTLMPGESQVATPQDVNQSLDQVNQAVQTGVDMPIRVLTNDQYAPTTSDLSGEVFRHAAEMVGASPESQAGIQRAGAGLPRALAGTALAAAAPEVGFPAMMGDAALQGYSQQHDPLDALVQAGTVGVAGKLVPMVGQMASGATARALAPSVEELAQLPSNVYGQAAARMVAPSALGENAIAAARMGSEAVAGTGVNEASRMVNEAVHGQDVQTPSIQSLAENAVQAAAFAPFDIAAQAHSGNSPKNFREAAAARTIKEADLQRQKLAVMDSNRGQRIADSHQTILDAAARGEDVTPLIADLKTHYQEADARRQPTAEQSNQVLMAMADQGGKMSELQVANLINSVTGKFDRIVEDDPMSPFSVSGAAILEMVKKGNLPQVSEEFIKSTWPEAYEQGVGDDRVTRENMVNRIVNHYQTLLPSALEAYRSAPAPESVTKKGLDAKVEADKDAAYIQSLVNLLPHMQGKKAPDGQPLDQALFERDRLMSNETQGAQLQQESRAWSRYDIWKANLTRFAQTFDPVTRTGEWTNTRRMADQTVVTGETQRIPLEDLAKYETVGKQRRYTVQNAVGRKQLPGKSPLSDRMMEYMDTRFNDEGRQGEKLTPFKPGDLTRAPDIEETEAFGQQKNEAGEPIVDTPVFTPEGDQKQLEAATYVVSKIEKSDSLGLWKQLNGDQIFGRAATTPGKAENFKNAILSRIEWEALPKSGGKKTDLKELSPSQQDFLNGWLKTAGGEAKELPKTWREQVQLFRHAQRLYWGQNGDRFLPTLEAFTKDNPELQKSLQGGQGKMSSVETDQASLRNEMKFNQSYGQIAPGIDTLRLFYGYAKENGLPDANAERVANIAHSVISSFPEVGKVGRMETEPKAFAQGIRISATNSANPSEVGIAFDRISETEQEPVRNMVRALQVLAHEVTHSYTHPTPPELDTAYTQARLDAYNKLTALFTDLGPDATRDLMNNVLSRVFTPDDYRQHGITNITAPGSNFEAESVSRLMEMVMLGTFTKSSPLHGEAVRGAGYDQDPFLWLPQDVQAYANFAFRDLANFTGGLTRYYDEVNKFGSGYASSQKQAANKTRAYLKAMFDYSNEFLGSTVTKSQAYETQGKRLLAFINSAGSSDIGDPIVTLTNQKLDTNTLAELARKNRVSLNQVEDNDPYGFSETQQKMFSNGDQKELDLRTEDQKRQGVTIPGWSHLFGQFYQAMTRFQKAGVGPIAENAMSIVNSLEPAYWRLLKQLHAPFTMVDANGDMKYDPQHPVQMIMRKSNPQAVQGIKALENLRQWAVDRQKAVVTTGPDGKTVVNPDAQDKVRQEIGHLDPATQQGVLEGLNSLVKGYQNSAEMRYSAEMETVSTQVAKFFMLKDKEMTYDRAFGSAQQAVGAGVEFFRAQKAVQQAEEQYKKVQLDPQLRTSPEGIKIQENFLGLRQNLTKTQGGFANATQGLSPEQQAVMQNYVLGDAGAAAGLTAMADMFTSRRDWFMSEQRPGRFLIFGKTPDDAKYANGKRDKGQADRLVKDLTAQGYKDLSIVDRNAQETSRLFDSPDSVVDSYIKLEQGAWQKFLGEMKGKLEPEDYNSLEQTGYEPGLASQKFVENKSLDRYLLPNKTVAGREDLNSFEVFSDYTKRLVGSVARKGTRQQIDLLLRDPRVKGNESFQQFVRESVNSLMQPVGERFQNTRAFITAYFLGLPNVLSPLIESSQSMTTILPEIIREGGDFVDGVKRFGQAPIDVYKYHDTSTTFEGKRLLQSAKDKEAADPRLMTKEESMALYYRRAKDDGAFSHGVVQESMLARDAEMFSQHAFGMDFNGTNAKTTKELAGDMLYWLSQKSMGLYSPVSQMNNKTAFMSGLSLYYDKGYRGEDLYRKAAIFKDKATFGGGKANEVGYVSKLANPKTRSWFSLVNTLQRFSFGYVTQLKDYVADVTGKTNLPPQERAAAAKAFSTSMAAQVALGGALAVPGAQILAALCDKLFNWDMKQAMRSLWVRLAKGLGADDPLAVDLANLAQNGVGGQFLGVDLSSRFALNSFLGFDSFQGFDTNNLAGPPAAIAERLIKAGQYVASKEFVKGGAQLLPPSLSPLLDTADQLVENGSVGMRSANGGLIQNLTPGETVKYALGAKPYWYRQYRDLQSYKNISERAYNQVRDQKVDQAATALRGGDPSQTQAIVDQAMKLTPTGDRASLVKSIIDRGLVQSNASDLLAGSVTGNEDNLQQAAATFGNVGRQSEVDLLVQREQMNATTGYQGGPPIDYTQITRAALIDALVKQGMVRSEAARQVGLMGY